MGEIRDQWGMGNERRLFINASHQERRRGGVFIEASLSKWGGAV